MIIIIIIMINVTRVNSLKLLQYFLTNKTFKRLSVLRNLSKKNEVPQSVQNNPYFDKYASKIAEVRKLTPEEFKKSLGANLKLASGNNLHLKNTDTKKVDKKQIKLPHFLQQNDLSQVMKLESVQEKTAQEIEAIWKEYHMLKDGVYAVLPAHSYSKMHTNLKDYPVFLFPLPRAQGYEFIMSQFLDQSIYFTSLINYQAFKGNASICLTVTYFTEFQKEKGIVLMRGEYDSSLIAHEAQCLTNQLQLYYGGQDVEKTNLLHKFNKQPDEFKHLDLIYNFELSFGN